MFVGEQIGAGYIANGQNFGAGLVVGDQCCVAAGGLVVGVQIAAGCVAGQVAAGYLAALYLGQNPYCKCFSYDNHYPP